MVEHPPFSDFEAFVAGASPASADFDAHVNGCDLCAGRLALEARVECTARALAREHRSRREWLDRLKGPGYLMGAVLAVAASLLVLFHGVTASASAESIDDVHGQPVSSLAPDAGFDGQVVAFRDAGPFRAHP